MGFEKLFRNTLKMCMERESKKKRRWELGKEEADRVSQED